MEREAVVETWWMPLPKAPLASKVTVDLVTRLRGAEGKPESVALEAMVKVVSLVTLVVLAERA